MEEKAAIKRVEEMAVEIAALKKENDGLVEQYMGLVHTQQSGKTWHYCTSGKIVTYPSMLCSMCLTSDSNRDFNPRKAMDEALTVAFDSGATDGAHHKMWVIDQMVRALAGTEHVYNELIRNARNGKDGPNTYEWDVGIAP